MLVACKRNETPASILPPADTNPAVRKKVPFLIPGFQETLFVDQAGFKLTEIHLPGRKEVLWASLLLCLFQSLETPSGGSSSSSEGLLLLSTNCAMVSQWWQAVDVFLATKGWVCTILSCLLPNWQVIEFSGSYIIRTSTIWKDLWKSCVAHNISLPDSVQGTRLLAGPS